MEFTGDGKGVLQGLSILLADGNGRGGGDLHIDGDAAEVVGRWAGDRIVIAGDYADPEEGEADNIYMRSEDWTDISSDVFFALCHDKWVRKDLMPAHANGFAGSDPANKAIRHRVYKAFGNDAAHPAG